MSIRPMKVSDAYKVRELPDTSHREWDHWTISSSGGGHIFQSYDWGEFKKSQGWKPLRLTLEKDEQVVGTAQFLLYSTLPVPGYLMYAPKGPWIDYDEPEAVLSFFRGVTEIASRYSVHTVKIEPEIMAGRKDLRALLEEAGFRDARYDLNFDTTIVVDLSPSEEEILDRMSGRSRKGKTTRYNINLANRNGVEVFQPESFDWAFETLYRWIEDLSHHKEGFTNRRPRSYFYDMMRRMYDAGRGHFFFAAYEGELLSGSFVLEIGAKLWFMHGASSLSLPKSRRKLQGNYLLQWEILRWARSRDIVHADFVGAPKEREHRKDDPYYGVYEFKKGFGGDVVEFVGCMDLPLKPRLAAAWYNIEPLYYRTYYKLTGNIFY